MFRIWLAASAAFALLQSTSAAQPAPARPSDTSMPHLLGAGLEGLCAGFLAAPDAAPASIDAMAAKAGFQSGAQGRYTPVGQPIPGAPAAMAFHADNGSADGGVEVFLTTVPTACQVRVTGDAGAWSAFVARMKRQGATLVTAAQVTPETTYSHEVYVGGIAGLPTGYTTFVNRWVGQGSPKSGAWILINVLPDTGAGG